MQHPLDSRIRSIFKPKNMHHTLLHSICVISTLVDTAVCELSTCKTKKSYVEVQRYFAWISSDLRRKQNLFRSEKHECSKFTSVVFVHSTDTCSKYSLSAFFKVSNWMNRIGGTTSKWTMNSNWTWGQTNLQQTNFIKHNNDNKRIYNNTVNNHNSYKKCWKIMTY